MGFPFPVVPNQDSCMGVQIPLQNCQVWQLISLPEQNVCPSSAAWILQLVSTVCRISLCFLYESSCNFNESRIGLINFFLLQEWPLTVGSITAELILHVAFTKNNWC